MQKEKMSGYKLVHSLGDRGVEFSAGDSKRNGGRWGRGWAGENGRK